MSYGEYYPDFMYEGSQPVDLVRQKQNADLASFRDYLQALRTYKPEALSGGVDTLTSTVYWDWFERPRDAWGIGTSSQEKHREATLDEKAAYYEGFTGELGAVVNRGRSIANAYVRHVGKSVLRDRPQAFIYCNIKPEALPQEASAVYASLKDTQINGYVSFPAEPSSLPLRVDGLTIVTNDIGLTRLIGVLASRQQGEGRDAYRPDVPLLAAPVRGMAASEALTGVSFSMESDVKPFSGFGDIRSAALADAALRGATEVAHFEEFLASEYAIDTYGMYPGCVALNASDPQAFKPLLPLTAQL